MPERLSRILFAMEVVLLGLPTMVIVLPLVVPGAFVLTPLALYGLLSTMIRGGPGWQADMWTGLGVLGMALLDICAVAAFCHFLYLATILMLRGRDGVRQKLDRLYRGMIWALPPFTVWSLPSLFEAGMAQPFDVDAFTAALVRGAFPLLIPVVHLYLESHD